MDTDSCLFSCSSPNGTVLLAVTVDDFRVITSTNALIDQLYSECASKYRVKRLGSPSHFIGWELSYPPDGSTVITQPALFHATISNANMEGLNGRYTQYTYSGDLGPPRKDDNLFPSTESHY